MNAIRRWLIRMLAGKSTVVLNATIGKDGTAITLRHDSSAYIDNIRFYNCDTAISMPHPLSQKKP